MKQKFQNIMKLTQNDSFSLFFCHYYNNEDIFMTQNIQHSMEAAILDYQ